MKMNDEPGMGVGGLLDALMEVPGVLAGMVATGEGLPLAARLRAGLDEEGLAAAAAVLGQLGSKALADIDTSQLNMLALDTSRLRFMVQPVALGYLLVVTDPRAEADPVAREMAGAAAGILRTAAALASPRAA